MLAPYKWLKDYVKTDASAAEIAEKMVMTGNGVEGIENLAENCQKVVVGRIDKIEKHPDADKLVVCSINIGEEENVQIVTGATNVFEGALVPAALHGSKLPNGVSIKKGKLRGVPSNGMLCSGEELCLTEADYPGAGVYGILILQEDWAPGTDINEVLMKNDTVIEFEIGSNRPDCLSILGIAKEASAALDAPIEIPVPAFKQNDKDINDYVQVEVKDPDLCPRYIAMMVENVKIGPSPRWMQERLKAAGVRSINNIVDITNYVMLETGQPMHAFDYNDIRGHKIIVRRAEDGEKMATLDEKEREFNSSMLMIADAEGAIGIAGVMGGLNSEIKDSTTTVVFESAKFMYGNIRRTSRALGLATEASMRFSKGVDAANSDYAIKRACQLVEMLGAGEIVGGKIDVLAEDLSEKTVAVTAKDINGLLGTDISEDIIVKCLERVFIRTERDGETILCHIPYFRSDIEGKADMAEEVARIYGYDNIPERTPVGKMMNLRDPKLEAKEYTKSAMVSLGYYECSSYSFTGLAELDNLGLAEDDPKRQIIKIRNPLGDDTGYMRTTLMADMCKILATNIKRKNKQLRMFELNKVYLPKSLPLTELPDERMKLCLGGFGEMDFFTMKGTIEALLTSRRISEYIEFRAGGGNYFHPGRKAEIFIGGKCIGEMGEIHPDVAANFGIQGRAYLAELDIDSIYSFEEEKIRYALLPKYPAIERDLALIVDADAQSGVIAKFLMDNGGKYIEKAELFDVYCGENIEQGKKSLAYSLSFRSKDGTLTDADIDIDAILAKLKDAFGAELRA